MNNNFDQKCVNCYDLLIKLGKNNEAWTSKLDSECQDALRHVGYTVLDGIYFNKYGPLYHIYGPSELNPPKIEIQKSWWKFW